MICGILCDRHCICRTADYDSTQKVCRLFETFGLAGTFLNDSTTSILILNYCKNETQTEGEYVCTRSGTFTVQQIFDKLALADNTTLSTSNRGIYVNMYGVYTSSDTGYLSFFTNDNVKTIFSNGTNLTNEITNINSAPFNGLSLVQYYKNLSIIYKNIDNQSSPQLFQTLNITLSGAPYSCVTTSEYLYVAYASSLIVMTIHNISTGLILHTVSRSSYTYRPVVSQWNDSIFLADECQIIEYNLTGIYRGNWSYFNGFQSSVRNYMHHDYAGRRYICNYGGTDPGIYVFLQNGTQIANRSGICVRGFQLYVTKEQATFINTPATSIKQIINF